jgi:hypothetical protein
MLPQFLQNLFFRTTHISRVILLILLFTFLSPNLSFAQSDEDTIQSSAYSSTTFIFEEEEEDEDEDEDDEDDDDDEDSEEDDDDIDEVEEDVPEKKDQELSFTKKKKKEKRKIPGLLQVYSELITIDQTKFTKKFNKIKNLTKEKGQPVIGATIEIDSDYLTSALFYTPFKYSQLAFNNYCGLYDLLQTGLLNTYVKSDSILVRTLDEKTTDIVDFTLPKQDFLDFIFAGSCTQSRKLKRYFNPPYLVHTMKKIQFEIPKDMPICIEEHTNVIKDIKTPYLCQIYNDILIGDKARAYIPRSIRDNLNTTPMLRKQATRGEKLRRSISDNQFDYIENLCTNLMSPHRFCAGFFDKSYWTRIKYGDRSPYYISYFCQDLLNKKKLKRKDLKTCIDQFIKDDDICHFIGKDYPSLTPKPNCYNASLALNHSRLFSNYKDCPGSTGNEAVVNIARIVKHFREKSELQYSDTMCSITSAQEFLHFNLENENENAWTVSLCYRDKVLEKDVCKPTLMANSPNSKFSLERVIADIMSKTKGSSYNMKCAATAKEDYRPILLKYKSGCHIIYDKKNCSAVGCDAKLIYNDKPISHIYPQGTLSFNYYATNYKDANYSQIGAIKRGLKVKNHEVGNLTLLKFHLKKNKKAIIHGIGCAAELLPTFYTKKYFNQCKPLPFIIDGTIKSEGKISLIVRTALDDLHMPRVIDWNMVYGAVKNYSQFHPTKTWSLHAVY